MQRQNLDPYMPLVSLETKDEKVINREEKKENITPVPSLFTETELTISAALDNKYRRLVALETNITEQFEPTIREQRCLSRTFGGIFLFLSSLLASAVILSITLTHNPRAIDYVVDTGFSIMAVFLLFSGLKMCRIRSVPEIKRDPLNLQALEDKTRDETKAALELHEIKIEAPSGYFETLRIEKNDVLNEIKQYPKRADQRFTFFCAGMERNRGTPLHHFIREIDEGALSALSTSIFEFAGSDIMPCPNRNMLKELLAPLARNKYEKQIQHNFFRRLAMPLRDSQRTTVFDEKKVINKILSYVG